MPDEITTASTTPAAEGTTQTAPTTDTASTSADNTGAAQVKPERTYSDAEVQKMMKDRLKSTKAEQAKYERMFKALTDGGVLDRNATADDIEAWVASKRGEDEGNPSYVAKVEADKSARAVMLDTKIDFAAQLLAGKDPLFADLDDEDILNEIRPIARMMNGDVKGAYLAKFGAAVLARQEAQTEARVLANVASKQSRKVESGEGGGEGDKLGLDAEELAFCRKQNIDPARFAALKGAKNLGDYERIPTKK